MTGLGELLEPPHLEDALAIAGATVAVAGALWAARWPLQWLWARSATDDGGDADDTEALLGEESSGSIADEHPNDKPSEADDHGTTSLREKWSQKRSAMLWVILAMIGLQTISLAWSLLHGGMNQLRTPWIFAAVQAARFAIFLMSMGVLLRGSAATKRTPMRREFRRQAAATGRTIAWAAAGLAVADLARAHLLLAALDAAASVTATLYAGAQRRLRVWEEDGRRLARGEKLHSREADAGLWQRALFSWLDDLLDSGVRRARGDDTPLTLNALWELLPRDQASRIAQKWTRVRLENPEATLLRQILRLIGRRALQQLGFALFSSALYLSGPFFVGQILRLVQNYEAITWSRAVWCVGGMFACAVLRALADGQTFFIGRQMGLCVRTALVHSLYGSSLSRAMVSLDRPALDRPAPAGTETPKNPASTGQIVNLMAVDAQKLSDLTCYLHYYVACPLQVALTVALLLRVLGWASVAGVAVMVLALPAGAGLGSRVQAAQQRFLAAADQRMRAVSESLQGIRVIKLLAWEPHFVALLTRLRGAEITALRAYLANVYGSRVLWAATPILVSCTAFATHVWVFRRALDAPTAFTALALFNSLRVPLSILPEFYVRALEMRVSLGRIAAFLAERQLPVNSRRDVPDLGAGALLDGAFGFYEPARAVVPKSRGSSTVSSRASSRLSVAPQSKQSVDSTASLTTAHRPTGPTPSFKEAMGGRHDPPGSRARDSPFRVVTDGLAFPARRLSLVIGPTGSGKTALLLALLGELQCHAGGGTAVRGPARVAFVPQQAWLQNATVRDNITFGMPFQAAFYSDVLHACALVKDLALLSHGDLTPVGEKGVNLSGGQRQRIMLARALYARTTVVLLDDCLSAVDAPTAQHLLEHAIVRILVGQQRATVILVTHAVQLCARRASHLVVLRGGSVDAHGTPAELQTVVDDLILAERRSREASAAAGADAGASVPDGRSASPSGAETGDQTAQTSTFTEAAPAEERSTGAVAWDVYRAYLAAAGGWRFVPLFLGAFVLAQSLVVGQDVWVNVWTSATAGGAPAATTTFYLAVYLAFGAALVFVLVARLAVQVSGSLGASQRLHLALLQRLFRAPIAFFDATPFGRILNRLGRDMQAIDQETMPWLGDFTQHTLGLASVLAVIVACTPVVLVPLVPVILATASVAKKYLATSRELKRLDSITRSPIYSLFSETMAGITTVRAFGAQRRFERVMHERLDDNNRCYFFLWASNRWLGVRVDLTGAWVGLVAAVAIMAAAVRGEIDAGRAGLSLSFALMFTEALLWVVRMHALLEMSLNSVERVQEYLAVAEEAPEIVPDCRPPAGWPHAGAIELQNVTLAYGEGSPLVLRGLSCAIPGGAKVGVVGRTGAGKSSLMSALFRLHEFGGRILIDGVDICAIGLRDLRQHLTIIPQDPVLFAGTVRSNLDLFGTFDSDAPLLEALHQVGLDAQLRLETPVAELGSNLSQGQRQLLCLARAFLRNSRVVVLDEPTSSVDPDADRRIQRAVRQYCRSATVLCIAHRLQTVADFDLILVMDRGRIVERGPPLELMRKGRAAFGYDASRASAAPEESRAWFWSMCLDSGVASSLLELASG